MADGRTRRLRDLRPGDRIYGTRREGTHRRYVITEVLDHWRTVKPGYRVTLADGTSVVASGDHRFLTDRGWEYVQGARQGRDRRPHLTPGVALMGTGVFAAPPKRDGDYRRGYLCGMIRGAGGLGNDASPHGASREAVHSFRLAPAGTEALDRSRRYLADFGVTTTEVVVSPPSAGRGEIRAVRAQSRAAVAVVKELVRWPARPSDEWRKGFLAGVSDAEGDSGVARSGDGDPRLLRMVGECLRHFAFRWAGEDPRAPGGVPVGAVRLRGGLRERLRFVHTTDPASTRSLSIEGADITGGAPLRVVSVEPLGLDVPLYDITTGTGDFIANGLVSHNCFARKTHEYLDLDTGADFDSKVVVKVNAAELARRELAAPRWRGEHIAMGTNVDCYQRAEGRYRLMPGIIAALRDAGNPFSILTKGSLILRDVPLLAEAAERTEVGTMVSVGSLDRELWRQVEPGTPSPGKRLEVCAALNGAGVECGVLMGPVLPYLSDSPRQLEEVVKRAAEAGATSIGAITLHLRPGAREWFLAWLRAVRPELVVPYARLYRGGAYAPKEYQERISGLVRELADKHGIRRRPGRTVERRPAGPEQLSLM